MSWYDPYSAVCKSGFYLRNPYTRQPFFCDGLWRGCPWRRWFKCESMTGSDDGWGVCCFDRGGKYYTIIDFGIGCYLDLSTWKKCNIHRTTSEVNIRF
jgi:hypothetical protein